MANNQQSADQTNLPPTNDDDPADIALPLPNAALPLLNGGSGGGGPNDSRACAACKYQRRRCASDCPLAPYFPPTEPEKFANVHKVFGLRNMMRVYKEVLPNQRDAAMESMIWEAGARAHDPIGGCYRIIQRLESEIQFYKVEYQNVLAQLEYFQKLFAANAAAPEAPGGSGGASGSNSKEPVSAAAATTYFPPPVSSQPFQGFYPDFQTGAAGLGFSDGNPIPNAIPIPPLESYLPSVSGYQDALAVISNKTLTSPAAATSSLAFLPPEPFCTAAAGGSEVTVAAGVGSSMKTEEEGQTLISSGSELSDSFFPVGGYQQALKRAMAFSSVDHDVGLLSKKMKNGDGKAIASSSAQPNLPVLSGYEDHDDVSFIPKNTKQESQRVNDGEKNDGESLKSQLQGMEKETEEKKNSS